MLVQCRQRSALGPRSGPGRPVARQSHPLLAIALPGRRGGPRAEPARCGAFGTLHQFKPACDGGPGRGGWGRPPAVN